jgi:hypothetical protein
MINKSTSKILKHEFIPDFYFIVLNEEVDTLLLVDRLLSIVNDELTNAFLNC